MLVDKGISGQRGFRLEAEATSASQAEKEVFSEAQTFAAVQGVIPIFQLRGGGRTSSSSAQLSVFGLLLLPSR